MAKRTFPVWTFFCCVLSLNSRQRFSMDFDWLFHLGSQDLKHITCTSSPQYFPSKTVNMQCQGLSIMDSVPNNNMDECANACCSNPTCALFQISPSGQCSIGDITSVFNPFDSITTCKNNINGYTIYSRQSIIPDIDPTHFIAATKEYDDSNWRKLNLPHDFIVEGTFNQNADMSHAYLPKNVSWYRKHFSLPTSYINNSVLWIDFDGIFRNCMVYINGIFLGNHTSGYTSFRYFLNANKHQLEYGNNSDNVLSVFVDATASEGWWYEGGGIYRHVWFNKANKIYFEPWNVYLPTHVSTVYNDKIHGVGDLIINATIINQYNQYKNINLKFDIINPNGTICKELTINNIAINGNSSVTVAPSYNNSSVYLWNLDNPALYKVNCFIFDFESGNEIDFVSLTFGYRKVIFDVNNGIYLNDKSIKIKGFANHQDFGGVGIATPERINRFRVQHLKSMGANAWRMSHNPPNPELLDFADEYGCLIWDENRHFGLNKQWLNDQKDMILRDRNHPSIIIWSICNEAGCIENNDTEIGNITLIFKNIIQQYDGIYNNNNKWGYNRPVSAAMNAEWGNYMSKHLDIQGINYGYFELQQYHESNPNQSIISSESCCCLTDRNEYIDSASDGHCSAYQSCSFTPGIICPAECWIPIANQSFVIGSFDWTLFDYKGEPTPYEWPDINSHTGVNDIIGFPKDDYFYYKSMWIDINKEIIIHIVPNTWNNDTGTNPVQMRIYTNCNKVQLFLNNKSLNNDTIQIIEKYQYYKMNVTWKYGQFEVKCYDENNNIFANKSIKTTNKPYAIKLQLEYPYNNIIIGDGKDVALINVFVVDNNNLIVPNATNLINFSVGDNDPGFILGVGNGNPSSHQPDKAQYRSVFHGKARVLIQSFLNQNGTITLIAQSNGLKSDIIHITVKLPSIPISVI